MKKFSEYDLIIFDMDGTLVDRDTNELLPNVKEFFIGSLSVGDRFKYAVATNQGGVGMRYWMTHDPDNKWGEPHKYPTEQDIIDRIDRMVAAINDPFKTIPLEGNLASGIVASFNIYVCYRYLSSEGNWSPVPPQYKDEDGETTDKRWNMFYRKPSDGMLLLLAMNEAGVSKEYTLMVGDSEEDQLAAKRAGCDFVWAWEFFDREKPQTKESV